jgi:hypothetical protein
VEGYKKGEFRMELQVRFGSRAYCFAEELDDLAKPVHLVIDEYVELLDSEGDFVTQERGQNARYDLTLPEAYFLIDQLYSAIEEAKNKVAEIQASA